jgi:hypothetical protein
MKNLSVISNSNYLFTRQQTSPQALNTNINNIIISILQYTINIFIRLYPLKENISKYISLTSTHTRIMNKEKIIIKKHKDKKGVGR